MKINLGKRIKEFRKIRGLTQKQLAEKLGVTTITIQNYENNRREPNIETIGKIANILNTTASELFGFEVYDIEGNSVNSIETPLNRVNNNFEEDYNQYKEDHKETIGEFRNKLNHLSDKERVKLLSNIFKSKEQKEFLNSLTEEQCNKLLEELSTTVDYLSYKLKNNNK